MPGAFKPRKGKRPASRVAHRVTPKEAKALAKKIADADRKDEGDDHNPRTK